MKIHGMVESGHERQEVLEGVELTEVSYLQSDITTVHWVFFGFVWICRCGGYKLEWSVLT